MIRFLAFMLHYDRISMFPTFDENFLNLRIIILINGATFRSKEIGIVCAPLFKFLVH